VVLIFLERIVKMRSALLKVIFRRLIKWD